MTQQVYGHVVASDSMNEAYIVPLRAIFHQIKNYAGTNLVRLAGENDIQKWRSRRTDGKTLVRKGAQRCHEVGSFASMNNASCITVPSNIRESKRSAKRTASGKRRGVGFSEPAPVGPSSQAHDNQSILNWALSLNQASSPLLTSVGSNAQQPKLYTPPPVAPFCMKETQESLPRLDIHEVIRVPSEWPVTHSPSDSDSISSPLWRRIHPETENEIKDTFTSRGNHEQSKKRPISSMEELTNLVIDDLHEVRLEYQRLYGTIAPWAELSVPSALKNNGWDSGYSTADSANQSPAP
jgi:hypothetical protein